jgi:hypothetical protein
MTVLVIDVGGAHIKRLATGRKASIKIPSGPKMTASRMVRCVREAEHVKRSPLRRVSNERLN